MKKLDLHIHTVAALQKDAMFSFELSKFEEYVNAARLDAVAVTNHNLFNLEQFNEISSRLSNIKVFPGIEIDFEKGHLLLISDNSELEDFAAKCSEISKELTHSAWVSLDKLESIFGQLTNYLLIPHFDKSPQVPANVLEKMGENIFTGEVCSPKKFQRLKKQPGLVTPLLFSDVRIDRDLDVGRLTGCHTFLKTSASDLTFQVIVAALRDKSKVFLNELEQEGLFHVLDDAPDLSFGLNVVLGNRSSGKTHFLSAIENTFNRDGQQVKHVRQFELVNRKESEVAKDLDRESGAVSEQYLKCFASVVSDVSNVDWRATEQRIGEYIDSLLKFADSESIQDEYSKCILFEETPFTIRPDQDLAALISSVVTLSKNQSHRDILDRHLSIKALDALLNDLKSEFEKCTKQQLRREWVNEAVRDIANALHANSASPHVEHNDLDFYKIKIEREKIRRFCTICKGVAREFSIVRRKVGAKFTIEASVGPIAGAADVRSQSHLTKGDFQGAFAKYSEPYEYLQALKNLNMDMGGIHRMFCKIKYHILNEYQKPVSGGERSEYNLLRSLEDSRKFELLLIDEPESSFDNEFLNENVNRVIKELATEMPVVVVTHNSTVGMLLKPDQILYTQREIVEGKDSYHIYGCSPGESSFKTRSGARTIASHKVLLDSLEAGEVAYNERRRLYENYTAKS